MHFTFFLLVEGSRCNNLSFVLEVTSQTTELLTFFTDVVAPILHKIYLPVIVAHNEESSMLAIYCLFGPLI